MDQPSLSAAVHISAVAFKEGDMWVVQGIEYDIATHVDDPADVPGAFLKAVFENMYICEHLGREPLAGIGPAPERFRDMFDKANTVLSQVRREPRAPDMDIRLLAAA